MKDFFNKRKQLIPGLLGAGLIATTVGVMNPSAAHASGFVTVTKEYNLDFEKNANGQQITDSTAGNALGIGNQWQDWGVTISANQKGKPNSSEPLVLFKSENVKFTGGDNDLRSGSNWGTKEQGNVLIVQEDGWKTKKGQIVGVKNADDPDDEANGAWITFDFSAKGPVNLTEFSLLDMDDDQDGRGNFLEVFAWDKDGNEFLINALSLVQGHIGQHGANGQGLSYTSSSAVSNNAQNKKSVTITQEGTKRGDNSLYTFGAQGFNDIVKLQYRYPGSGAIAGIKWNKEERRKVPEPGAAVGFMIIGSIFIRNARKRQSLTPDC